MAAFSLGRFQISEFKFEAQYLTEGTLIRCLVAKPLSGAVVQSLHGHIDVLLGDGGVSTDLIQIVRLL